MPWAGSVALLAGIDQQCSLAGACEHQPCRQPGCAATDDDAVPRFVHDRDGSWVSAVGKLKLPNMATRHRPPSAPPETTEARVRRRLRELRLANGMTLREVAASAHLDVSTLSRLESGQRRLVLDHLPPLADALGVTTDELLSPPSVADPRVASRPIRRNGLTMWPLNHAGSTNRLQTYKVHIPVSRRRPPATLPVHDGHDWMYVLSRPDAADPRRRGSHHRTRRGSRVRHHDPALVRRRRWSRRAPR